MTRHAGTVERRIVLGLVGLVVFGGVAIITGVVCINYSLQHRSWTGVDEDADEDMREVTELPVLWLGESYDPDGDGEGELVLSSFDIDGLNARGGASAGAPQYRMYVGYGRCLLPAGEGGCGLPLSIAFDPPCRFIGEPPPRLIPDVRGVEARDAGDSIYLMTRDYQIRIWPPHADAGYREEALRVAEQLRGANELARDVTPGSDLPRLPDGYC